MRAGYYMLSVKHDNKVLCSVCGRPYCPPFSCSEACKEMERCIKAYNCHTRKVPARLSFSRGIEWIFYERYHQLPKAVP